MRKTVWASLALAACLGGWAAGQPQFGESRDVTFHSIPRGAEVIFNGRFSVGYADRPIHLTSGGRDANFDPRVEVYDIAFRLPGYEIEHIKLGVRDVSGEVRPVKLRLQPLFPPRGEVWLALFRNNPLLTLLVGAGLAGLGTVLYRKGRASASSLTPQPKKPPQGQRTFGDFHLREELGRGYMGKVFRALDSSGQEVAVKELFDFLPAQRARLREDFARAAGLDHPNLLRLDRVFEVGDQLGYVMQLVPEGVSLRDRLTAGLTRGELVPVIDGVVEGLDYLHSRGFGHGDLKPENVLFQGQRACLSDYGFAPALRQDALIVTRGTQATLPYLAPEQYEGQEVTPATDQHALAVLLFEALAGMPAFAASDVKEGKKLVTTRPFPQHTAIPAELQKVLERMADKNPALRFPTVKAAWQAARPTFF